MKIYEHIPIHILRIHIHKQGEQRKYLSIVECKMDEFINWVKILIKKKDIDPFAKGFKTKICVREAIGGKNLGSKSISFTGLSSEETYTLIVNSINNAS